VIAITSFFLGALYSVGAAQASGTASLSDLLDAMRQDLTDLKVMVSAVRNPQLRHQMYREMGELDLDVADLQWYLDGSRVIVISGSDFSQLRSAVKSQVFGDDQLAMLRSASTGRAFTSDQVSELMRLFTFGDDRVAAAAMLYPQVVDPENWFIVYGRLTFSSEKDELRALTH
jgi:hypothetical protein